MHHSAWHVVKAGGAVIVPMTAVGSFMGTLRACPMGVGPGSGPPLTAQEAEWPLADLPSLALNLKTPAPRPPSLVTQDFF